MVDDEEREARSDEGREEKSAEHTRVSWGGNRSCYCQTNAYKLYTKHRNYERRYAETGSRVQYGGAGEIDNI